MSRLSSADNILAKRRRCSRNGSSVQPEREQRAAGTGAACSWNGSGVFAGTHRHGPQMTQMRQIFTDYLVGLPGGGYVSNDLMLNSPLSPLPSQLSHLSPLNSLNSPLSTLHPQLSTLNSPLSTLHSLTISPTDSLACPDYTVRCRSAPGYVPGPALSPRTAEPHTFLSLLPLLVSCWLLLVSYC